MNHNYTLFRERPESEEKFCYFCKQSIGRLSGSVVQLTCQNHEVEVQHWFAISLAQQAYDIRFRIRIKNNLFTVNYWPCRNTTTTKVFIQETIYFKNCDPTTKKDKKYFSCDVDKEIVNVSCLLNITPENAAQKLPIILIFS